MFEKQIKYYTLFRVLLWELLQYSYQYAGRNQVFNTKLHIDKVIVCIDRFSLGMCLN